MRDSRGGRIHVVGPPALEPRRGRETPDQSNQQWARAAHKIDDHMMRADILYSFRSADILEAITRECPQMRVLALALISTAMMSAAHATPLDKTAIYNDLNHSIGRCITTVDAGKPTERESTCTCALVAQDIVITAQHCVSPDFDTRMDADRKDKVRFRPRLNGREYGGVKIIARGEGAAGNRPDWMTIRLNRPVPDGKPLPISLASAGEDHLAIVGYGSLDESKEFAARVRPNCRIMEQQATLIIHNCQVLPGDSGSPLVAYDGIGWRILAINHAIAIQQPIANIFTLKNLAARASPEMLSSIVPKK